MTYSPVEIRHVRLAHSVFGYRRAAVDRLLDDVADSFEAVWRGRAELADKVEQLEAELTRHRELEGLLRTTLISAERAGADLRQQARRETEVILAEAHAEAASITRRAVAEHERLLAESRRIRAQLRAALETAEEESVEAADAEAA